MSLVEGALSQLGVDLGTVENVAGAISVFNNQNLTPDQVLNAAQTIKNVIGGNRATGVGAPGPSFGGNSGEFQSIRYGYDLNSHHPKFKFLFKVGFYGFTPEVRDFYYFVNRCDKPRVKFQHTDVNYYNFRTRVLTGMTFEPLTIEFLDEIGDSVNQFFSAYMRERSGQGNGGWGIQDGFGKASSTYPYKVNGGYGAGTRITLEQIFANGTQSNRFHFLNPRVESFDFSELNMEESAGSIMTISFSYDALECETVGNSVIHTWGDTDLLRGGGTSGPSNGGATSLSESGIYGTTSSGGLGIGSPNDTSVSSQGGLIYAAQQAGQQFLNQVPASISDMVNKGVQEINPFNHQGVVGSAVDTVSSNIQDTLRSITSGDNLQFNGADTTTFNDRQFSGEVLTDAEAASILAQQYPS